MLPKAVRVSAWGRQGVGGRGWGWVRGHEQDTAVVQCCPVQAQQVAVGCYVPAAVL